MENEIEPQLFPDLRKFTESLLPDLAGIERDRKAVLKRIAEFAKVGVEQNGKANLIFICTHNSRRSHLSQHWANVAAKYYGLDELIHNFSGGTEVTAFNPRAVAALERAGFRAEASIGENPHYLVRFSNDSDIIESYSKIYDDEVNPRKDFGAVMTCSHADENCPFIPGAAFRVALPYEDPKESDGSPQETATYDERSREIATEMFYLFSELADRIEINT